MCNTNNCPSGVATQDPELRKRLKVQGAAERLARFFEASTELMQVLARACGYTSLGDFRASDLTSFDRALADLAGVSFAGPER
jgi:glutamate synthase domain-containing protein 2